MKRPRRAERRETLAYWPARDEQSGEPVGFVTDLSEEGINLHSQAPFGLGHRLNIRVVVDPKLTGLHHLLLHIENAWCRPSEVKGMFHAGFRLRNLSDESRQGIRKLLANFSYPAPHKTG